MIRQMDFQIRPLTPADEPILWEMLYQGLQGPEGKSAPSRHILQQSDFAQYVEGWGRAGDAGFVAHDATDRQLLGAVWFRRPIGDAIPQLAFAVQPGHRKRGIGASLLTQWVRANPQQDLISLKVGPGSPAVRLYERFGFKVAEQSSDAVVMRREM